MSTLREGIRIWLFDREKCPRSPRCSLGTRTALIPLSNCVLVLSGSEVCPAHTGRRSWASIETYTFNVNEGATPGSSFSLVGLPALKCDGNGVSNWPQQSRSQTDLDPNRSCRAVTTRRTEGPLSIGWRGERTRHPTRAGTRHQNRSQPLPRRSLSVRRGCRRAELSGNIFQLQGPAHRKAQRGVRRPDPAWLT